MTDFDQVDIAGAICGALAAACVVGVGLLALVAIVA